MWFVSLRQKVWDEPGPLTPYWLLNQCQCLCGILHFLQSWSVRVWGTGTLCILSAPWSGVQLCFAHLCICLWNWSSVFSLCAKQILTCGLKAFAAPRYDIWLCLTWGRQWSGKGRKAKGILLRVSLGCFTEQIRIIIWKTEVFWFRRQNWTAWFSAKLLSDFWEREMLNWTQSTWDFKSWARSGF